MPVDIALIETGNGGDLQMKGSDLALVFGLENMPYMAMFGGNVEQSTKAKVVEVESFDWWGNNLLMPYDPKNQFNSLCERYINTIPLTSEGRVLIENGIKSDLEFFRGIATVSVTVSIVATDRLDVKIIVNQNLKNEQIIIINFKKSSSGDFWILDFNNDFLI